MTSTTATAVPAQRPGPASTDAVADTGAEAGRYLTFTLKGEVYALDILEVTEIIEFRALTVVPMMPSFVRGVTNLRGRVLPVIDLAARFGQGRTEVGRRTAIIVVDLVGQAGAHGDGGHGDGGHAHGHREMGIVVDAVTKVVPLPAQDMEAPPAFGGGVRADFISGMARWDDTFVVVLDLSHVLSVTEMVELGRVSAQQDPDVRERAPGGQG